MPLLGSDQDSTLSVSLDSSHQAGPSSVPLDAIPLSNGHTNGNGFSITNGSSGAGGIVTGNGICKPFKGIGKVTLPGTTLYDDSHIDREEFVRLVIQCLWDVGYTESAETLEAESGYSMETSQVSRFRRSVLQGSWNDAEAEFMLLSATSDEGIWEARFLISQQKYLELLESRQTSAALQVLRNELVPLNVDPDQLRSLSSLIMCSDPEDLRQRADWDGAAGTSRRRLLTNLQRYIPPSVMIPPRRISTVLQQASTYQRQQCIYHNTPSDSQAFSLYVDHQCDKSAFPRVTTTILQVHSDEVWNMEWSHDGAYLASAGKDKSAIIWRIEPETELSMRECAPEHILADHPYPVGYVAWSPDDSVLLTSAENFIKLWNAKTGACNRVLDGHTETVTALRWLPDGSGFISGGLDRKIILWDADGKLRDSWGTTPIRVTDLAVTPDFTRLVAVGMHHQPGLPIMPDSSQPGHESNEGGSSAAPSGSGSATNGSRKSEHRVIIYDLSTKQMESSIRLEGELTSVKVTKDSQYALINHSPDEIHLWDLNAGRLARKFSGQRQGRHVIRSCFGGVDENFVVSGSEDGSVYIWHRDSGMLLEVLGGHGAGSVNSVAWNPKNERMFASCSDDRTIRIWEVPPSDMSQSTAGGSDSHSGVAAERSPVMENGETRASEGGGSETSEEHT